MDVVIKQIRKQDFDKAREFSIEGMHLSRYTSNKFELYMYSKYFWYSEISKATNAIGAYMGDRLVGVLLANIYHKPKLFISWWYKLFVKLVSFVINFGYGMTNGTYQNANQDMLRNFRNNNSPDGEINFFAVDPTIKGKGIGSLLLNELGKEAKGKLVYLFTDSGCTYQFYQHRGFEESDKRNIQLEIQERKMPLTCFLFSKIL